MGPSCGSGGGKSDEQEAAKDSPAPRQRMPLGTHRERSSIPSGKGERDSGSDEIRWVYPSEQQFFNALLRKGWQPDERDVPAVVHIHNQVSSPL